MRTGANGAVVALLLLTSLVSAFAAVPGSDATATLDASQFAAPPNEYRPIDCWWWEGGILTEERLREQITDMYAKGVGGTWLYPRFGASQPQSSEPGFWTEGWWEFVRFALDEQHRLGMVQYANDWLGRLDKGYFQSLLRQEAKQNPRLVGQRLVAHFARSTAEETLSLRVPTGEHILSAAAYQLQEAREDAVDDDSRIDLIDAVNGNELTWEAPGPEWLVVVVTSQPHDLNYLERHVADRWIEIYYEQYRKRLGDRLGKSLVAYGPDERSVLNGNILYADELRRRFEKKHEVDPLPDLAALFIDVGPRTDSIRCQYYDAMNELLEENLYAPMAEWLHNHNMKHVTIATWGRESLLEQTRNYGDFPRMMKYFDIPGNEDSRQSGPTGEFIDTKLSSSMAHLNGRNRVAVCAYWGMGWGFTQEENIARTNNNYAYGVNLYNSHGVLYSLLAGRNEYVPPEVHFYQPYWQTWRTFTDYVSRLSYVLSQGRHRADVALLYPLSTIHAQWHSGSKFEAPAEAAESTTFALAQSLYADLLDFDFVDETRLAEAEITPGKIALSGLEFPVVALPAITTIRTDVVENLRKFVAAGGTLVIYRQPPTASAENGRDDPLLQEIWLDLLGDYQSNGDPVFERRNDAGGRTILVRSSDVDVTKAIRAAIRPDVTTAASGLAHTHQQNGDQHIYYFVNKQPQSQTVDVQVRAQGRPEVWDARTGEIAPLHEAKPLPHGTELKLEMGPHEGVLVVLQPGSTGPQIVSHNLRSVKKIERLGEKVEVIGTPETAGELQAEVSLDGSVYSGKAAATEIAAPVKLDGFWECEYSPTMNNKWGDYRYPASNEMIGPEAPFVKYRAETAADGASPAWRSKEFNDDDWQQASCTFGPYWQTLDPISARLDSKELQKKVVAAASEPADAIESDGESLRWQPYNYSWKFGVDRPDVHQFKTDGLGPVSPNFLVLDPPRGAQSTVRYLATRVFSPRKQTLYFDFGGLEKAPPRQAWVNGNLVVDVSGRPLKALNSVELAAGWNDVVLRIEQTGRKPLATFALFHAQPQTPDQPRFMPLSRWYDVAQDLVYDCYPKEHESIGWYRFVAPPGAKQAKLNLVAESVEAWVDGQPIDVVDDVIHFTPSAQGPAKTRQVALRVHNKPGHYEGAAFQGPIAFTCGAGQIALGDWSNSGLQYYSGGLKYKRRFHLTNAQASSAVSVDLGDVRTSAEVKLNGLSVGVQLARPFIFDLSDVVKPGENVIEIEVLNTLANFMSAGHSKYVYKGQTVSGLLGPVSLQVLPEVRIQCLPQKVKPISAGGAQ